MNFTKILFVTLLALLITSISFTINAAEQTQSGIVVPTTVNPMTTTTTVIVTQPAPAVTTSTTEPPSDAEISHNIQVKINDDKTLAGSSITATSKDGIVVLDGIAKNEVQVAEAARIARSVKGVKDIVSKVTIQSIAY